MARILYGISGDGFGHATRAKEIISHLQEAGHELCLVSYDKGYDLLSKYFAVEAISGLRLSYSDNEVKYLATVSHNLLKSKSSIESLDRVRELAKSFKPDLVITDFEPTVNLIANLHHLPLISIDNMHVITKTDIVIPEQWYSDYLIAKLVVRMMVFNAQKYFVLNFFDCQSDNDKTELVRPVVRREILELEPSAAEHILVYLNNDYDKIVPILAASGHQFIVYGLSRSGTSHNLIFKPLGSPDFLQDLATAKGIIATAGFSLMSEALYLHKPMLTLPIKNQFEQFLNAYYLDHMGYGLMSQELDSIQLETFVKAIDHYADQLSIYHQDGNAALFQSLDQTIKQLL